MNSKEMIGTNKLPESLVKLTFGKHAGKFLNDIPAAYLIYLLDKNISVKYTKVHEYILKHHELIIVLAANEKRDYQLDKVILPKKIVFNEVWRIRL